MKKRNRHKAEQVLAWFTVILIVAAVSTGFVFLFIKIKTPLMEKASSFWKNLNTVQSETDENENNDSVEAEEKVEEAPVESTLKEEDLEKLFADTQESAEEDTDILEETEEYTEEAEQILEKLSLSQKVAQLFFAEPEAVTGVDPTTAAGEKTRLALSEIPVGGIILSKKNLESDEQLRTMTANLQRYSDEIVGLPVFIGIDEKGKGESPIAGNELFEVEETDSISDIGASGDSQKAYDTGAYIGSYLKDYGFNVDMALAADIAADGNQDLSEDSFGQDPEMAGELSVSYMSGLKDAGILGVPKHFPGLGAVSGDGDKLITDKDWGELSDSDLIPFQKLIDNDVKFLMVSHMSVPEVTGDEIPVSMSGIILTEKLRLQMGYKGIIITDSMKHSAVTGNYEADKAVVEALKAGADMILMPENLGSAIDGVLAAVNEGTISEERINDSCRKVILTKLHMCE